MDRVDANSLILFASVVEAGSFAAVARERRQARSVVSRQIAKLEEDLGVRLLQRNTRTMGLTADGERILQHARRIRQETLAASTEATAAQAAIAGSVRVASAVHFGRALVLPVVSRLIQEHPALRVELRLEDRTTDVVGGAFDVAFRIGHPADSSMMARRLGNVHVAVCASAGYLRRRGTPEQPEQLAEHDALAYASESVAVSTWGFTQEGQARSVQVRPRLTVNDGDALLEATLQGAGVALLPRFLAASHLRRGRLRVLFEDVAWDAYAPVFALYPSREHVPPKVRVVLDAVASAVGDDDALRP